MVRDTWSPEERRSAFESLLLKYWPKGWRVRFHNESHYDGRAHKNNFHGRLLSIPPPESRQALMTGLHEIGHVRLGHFGKHPKPRYVEEFEAEHWAIATMRREGVPVPRSGLQKAKDYVAWCVQQDRPAVIEERVRRWLGPGYAIPAPKNQRS